MKCFQVCDKRHPYLSRMLQPQPEANRDLLTTSHTHPFYSQLQEDHCFNGANSRLVLLSAPIEWSYWQLCSSFMEQAWLVSCQSQLITAHKSMLDLLECWYLPKHCILPEVTFLIYFRYVSLIKQFHLSPKEWMLTWPPCWYYLW